jgi:hypothetical protein
VEEHIGQDRQHDEEIEGADVAARRRLPQQPDNAERQSQKEEVNAPALAERIEAVHEIGEPHADEGPASARIRLCRRRKTDVAVGSGPNRIDEEKPN